MGERGNLHRVLLAVARRMQAQVAAADGAGATLLVAGRSVFTASNSFTQAIDAAQHGLGEGPCLAAVASRKVVWSGTIGAGESRWPRLVRRAKALTLGSALSAPILAGEEAIGALNLYARAQNVFDAADVTLIRQAARDSERELRGLHLQATAEAAAAGLASAIRDRTDIEVAVGVLMDRYTLSAGQARLLLRQLAQQDDTDEVVAARRLIDPYRAR